MTVHEQLTLRAGSLELVLSPSLGGAIRGLNWVSGDGASRPLMRACLAEEPTVLDMASFPLVPYVNRLRGGRFDFRGREVRLQPNMAGDISPLHGQGWLSPWTVESAGECSARLHFEHQPGEWPWSYEAVQTFDLDEGGLSLVLSCTNLSGEPMPCGPLLVGPSKPRFSKSRVVD